MGSYRTASSETTVPAAAVCRASADSGSSGADRHSVRAAQRHSVADVAPRDGLWLRHHVLAAARAMAARRRLEAIAPGAAHRITAARPTRFRTRDCRQHVAPRDARGKKTGPNPTDRRKAGSKHHVLTDAHGIPLVATLTAANRHDITQLLPLVDALPVLRGRPGRPVTRPQVIQGDRGYDSQPHRDHLHRRGIATELARRGAPHGSGLGRTRWVIERTIAWLHRFRRLAVRYERRPCIHEAFLTLACALICWYYLRPVI